LENQSKIILVSDIIADHLGTDYKSRTLEYAEQSYFNKLSSVLKKFNTVLHLNTPKQLIQKAPNLNNELILSIWSGKNSRSRRALVPSICEAYGLKYIGPDPYTAIICQDKATAHNYCKRFNIDSPDFITLQRQTDIQNISLLTPPLIVKPNFEGGSIGIDEKSLAFNIQDAKQRAQDLMSAGYDQIMVQKFIEGDEVSFIVFGNQNEIKVTECVKLRLDTNEIDLSKTVYSLDIKKHARFKEINEVINNSVIDREKIKVKELFKSFTKCELLRVDGRIDKNGNFFCIELTPDVWLGENSSIFHAFSYNGYSYESMLRLIISNSLRHDLD